MVFYSFYIIPVVILVFIGLSVGLSIGLRGRCGGYGRRRHGMVIPLAAGTPGAGMHQQQVSYVGGRQMQAGQRGGPSQPGYGGGAVHGAGYPQKPPQGIPPPAYDNPHGSPGYGNQPPPPAYGAAQMYPPTGAPVDAAYPPPPPGGQRPVQDMPGVSR